MAKEFNPGHRTRAEYLRIFVWDPTIFGTKEPLCCKATHTSGRTVGEIALAAYEHLVGRKITQSLLLKNYEAQYGPQRQQLHLSRKPRKKMPQRTAKIISEIHEPHGFQMHQDVWFYPAPGKHVYADSADYDGRILGVVVGFTPTRVRVRLKMKFGKKTAPVTPNSLKPVVLEQSR